MVVLPVQLALIAKPTTCFFFGPLAAETIDANVCSFRVKHLKHEVFPTNRRGSTGPC